MKDKTITNLIKNMNTKLLIGIIFSFLFIAGTATAQNTCPVLNGSQLMQCQGTGNCVNNMSQCPKVPVGNNTSSGTSNVSTGSFTERCSGLMRSKDTGDAERCAELAEQQGRALGYDIECTVESSSYEMSVPGSARAELEANGYTGITEANDGTGRINVPVTDNIGSCKINGSSDTFDPRTLVGYSSNQAGYIVPDPKTGTTQAYGSGFNLNSMWYSVPCTLVDNFEGKVGGGSLAGATTCTSGASQYFGSSNPGSWTAANKPATTQGTTGTSNTSTQAPRAGVTLNPSVQGVLTLLNDFVNRARSAYGLAPVAATPTTGGTNNTTGGGNTTGGTAGGTTSSGTTGGTGSATTIPQANPTVGNATTVTYGAGETLSSTRFIRIETNEMGWVSWREIEAYDSNGTKVTPVNATGSLGSFVDMSSAPSKAIDGNTATAWNAGETNPNCMAVGNPTCPRSYRNAYITVDLGSAKNISRIKLSQNGDTVTESSKVFVSSTGSKFTQITSVSAPMRDGEWLEYPTPTQSGTPTLTFTINGGSEATVNTVSSAQTINFNWSASNADILTYTISENGSGVSWSLPPTSLSVTTSMFDPLDTDFGMTSYYNSLTNYQKLLPLSGSHGMWIPKGLPGVHNPELVGKTYTITLKAKQKYGGAETTRSVVIKF